MQRTITDEMIERAREQDPEVGAAIDAVYAELGDSMTKSLEDYHARYMTPSMCVLTVLSKGDARRIVKPIRGAILNKTVVEIGAGVGYLALELAKYSPRVFAIEADPGWSWIFTKHLYELKPPHLTWIFGRAEEVARYLRADVAIIATRSGHEEMQDVARRMAPTVMDIYQGRDLA